MENIDSSMCLFRLAIQRRQEARLQRHLKQNITSHHIKVSRHDAGACPDTDARIVREAALLAEAAAAQLETSSAPSPSLVSMVSSEEVSLHHHGAITAPSLYHDQGGDGIEYEYVGRTRVLGNNPGV